jgi:nicotinamidase-related amidase
MREFLLYVPSDCSAARSREEHEQAIQHIKAMTSASVVPSAKLRLSAIQIASRRAKTKA